LIPRLLDAPENTILIDDGPVRWFPLEQLRKAIGVVPQETFLFSNTLAENIAFGVESRDVKTESENGFGNSNSKLNEKVLHPEEFQTSASGSPRSTNGSRLSIERAAEIADIADDIKSFPYQYEQRVGERGITLSGGQKQRTAIARAVIRNPHILILDDSLSAVDTYTEEKILRGLREVRENQTTLIISHRISTVRDADLICVLHKGQITERGTHEELIKIGGEYAALYERQLLEDELEATE
jgi:ATP-binding cassette subfamily B protein